MGSSIRDQIFNPICFQNNLVGIDCAEFHLWEGIESKNEYVHV